MADARGPSAEAPARPRGLPGNQWRYQFNAGRWWYRTADAGWSYYDGTRWRRYVAEREFDRRRVDPALLNIEAKEGVLGNRKWPRVAGGEAGGGGAAGGGLLMSGTRGSSGGSYGDGIGGLGGGWRPSAGTGIRQPNMGMRGR